MNPKMTDLLNAAGSGNIDVVRNLLLNGVSPSLIDAEGDSVLMHAALHGQTEVARLLLQGGADINYRSLTEQTAISVSVEAGQHAVVRLLLEYGVDPDERYEQGGTMLMLAAGNGFYEVVQILLKQKANVNLKGNGGITALFFAINNGNEEIVKALLDNSANVDERIDEGNTPALLFAIHGDRYNIAHLLLKYNADPNMKTTNGFTALHSAVMRKKADLVEVLLSRGADCNIVAPGYVTMLHQAVGGSDIRTIYLLLNAGADTEITNEEGYTPLARAAIAGQSDVAEMLLKHGANSNARQYQGKNNSHGSTALMLAAEIGNADMVKILLRHDANPDLKDSANNTALSIARHYGRSSVVNQLQGVTTGESFAQTIAHGVWGGMFKAARHLDNVSQGDVASDASKNNAVRGVEAKGELGKPLQLCLNELNNLPGLHQVKAEVNQLINFLRLQQMRKEKGFATPDRSLHMVFTGNPGTGKTTIARLLAQIYKNLGVLNKGHLVETDRSGLVASYLGQTAPKVHDIVRESLGGLLFIDEAYTLAGSSQRADEFGQEAIDTLLKLMEDHRDNLVVIVAGYTEPMQNFIRSNPGLQSRFNNFLHFDDYATAELTEIFKRLSLQGDYKLHPATELKLNAIFTQLYGARDETFGNARLARNLFEKAINNHANRMVSSATLDEEGLVTLYPEDLPNI